MKKNLYLLLLVILLVSCSKEDKVERTITYSYESFVEIYDTIENKAIESIPIKGMLKYKNSENGYFEKEFSFNKEIQTISFNVHVVLKENESFFAEMRVKNNKISSESLGSALVVRLLSHGKIRSDNDHYEDIIYTPIIKANTTQELANKINEYLCELDNNFSRVVKYNPD